MQISYQWRIEKFNDLIQQQKAQIQHIQKPFKQNLDIQVQQKTFKVQDSKKQKGYIKQLNLPQLMKRIYSDQKLQIKSQLQLKNEYKTQQSIDKDTIYPKNLKNINKTSEQRPRLANIASTDRFQIESKERKEFMNYTFGSQFRLRGANLSPINSNSQITQKRSTSQSSRIMTNSQQRVVNKIFS